MNKKFFYVYAVVFDQECFGVYATREEAEESLDKQMSSGGPAWDGCDIAQWKITGVPEVSDAT